MYAWKLAWALLVALSGVTGTLQAAPARALGTTLWRFQAPLLDAFALMQAFSLEHMVSPQPTAWCLLAPAKSTGSGVSSCTQGTLLASKEGYSTLWAIC